MKRQTLFVLIINIEEREMITGWYSELKLGPRGVSFKFFIMRANPDVLHLKKKLIN